MRRLLIPGAICRSPASGACGQDGCPHHRFHRLWASCFAPYVEQAAGGLQGDRLWIGGFSQRNGASAAGLKACGGSKDWAADSAHTGGLVQLNQQGIVSNGTRGDDFVAWPESGKINRTHGDSRVWVCLATANLPTSLPVNSLFPQSPRRTFLAPHPTLLVQACACRRSVGADRLRQLRPPALAA